MLKTIKAYLSVGIYMQEIIISTSDSGYKVSITNTAMQTSNLLMFIDSELDRLNLYLKEGKITSSINSDEITSVHKRIRFLTKVQSDLQVILKAVEKLKEAYVKSRPKDSLMRELTKEVHEFNTRHGIELNQSFMLGAVTLT